MNAKQLDDALNSARGHHETPVIQEIDLGGGASLALSLTAVDAFACLVDEIAVRTPKLAGASAERLREIGQALSAKLTYLLEPIRLIETDAEAGEAQLRSSPPQRSETGAAWYEILVRRGGQIALCRYGRDDRQPRRRIPAQLTREVVGRLCDDLVQAAG
jgi:hypothetical protein